MMQSIRQWFRRRRYRVGRIMTGFVATDVRRGRRSPFRLRTVNYLVTKELLDLHDQYDGDLGLLDERWAAKEDRERFSDEQMRTLGEYIEQMRLRQVETLSRELRQAIEHRIGELEALIAPDVIATLQKRPC